MDSWKKRRGSQLIINHDIDLRIPPQDMLHGERVAWIDDIWISYSIHGATFAVNTTTQQHIFLGEIEINHFDGKSGKIIIATKEHTEPRIVYDEEYDIERAVHQYTIKLYNFLITQEFPLNHNIHIDFFTPDAMYQCDTSRLILQLNPQGTYIICALDFSLEIRNSVDLKLIRCVDLKSLIFEVKLLSNGNYLFVKYHDGSIDVFDAHTWKPIHSAEYADVLTIHPQSSFLLESQALEKADLDDLFIETYEKEINLRNIENGELIERRVVIANSGEAVIDFACSSDGSILAGTIFDISHEKRGDSISTWTSGGKVRMWHLPSFQMISELNGVSSEPKLQVVLPLSVDFSPNSKRIAILYNNQSLRIWKFVSNEFSWTVPSVFISCNHKDVELAMDILSYLNGEKIQSRLYEIDVSPGDSISEFLESSIVHSKTMILLWSKHAKESYWVNEEYRNFHAKLDEDPLAKILLVLLDNTPAPPLLKDKRHIKYSNNVDDLKKKLLWGITGNYPE